MRLSCAPSLPFTILGLLAATACSGTAIAGSTIWTWTYSATGITAGGTFTTDDTPDGNGGFLITALSGMRNGIPITGLQPAGTAIPGNEPYAVDDLVFLGSGPQLTSNGFGFSLADGTFANPFYADFLPAPEYLEFFSAPPFTDGGQGSGDSELPIQFDATTVPEPAPSVFIFGVFAVGAFWLSLRKTLSCHRRPVRR